MNHIHQNTNHLIIIILLTLTAIFELLGTITVAINYYKTSEAAQKIANHSQPNYVMEEEFNNTRQLAKELTSKWYLIAGLIAYVLGATFGLLGGLAAIYYW